MAGKFPIFLKKWWGNCEENGGSVCNINDMFENNFGFFKVGRKKNPGKFWELLMN